ncbi:MAG: exodeoxyribonuclease III [Hyphomicrobiaceae bacterium]
MKIATWNINGIKARMESLLQWLKSAEPDVLCLQEIKSLEESFPAEPIEALGYNLALFGQKGFNGVAILSRQPIGDVQRGLPGDPADMQARYLEAVIPAGRQTVRVASIYLPNGNPIGTEKYAYKLDWMGRLEAHARHLLALEEMTVLAGDYNVIPEPRDAHDATLWTEDALFQPASRSAFRSLSHLGYTDAIRTSQPGEGVYTFWDYQAGAWQKDNGIRIDHLMLSPEAADRLNAAGVDRQTRAWEKPSDHVPAWIELST